MLGNPSFNYFLHFHIMETPYIYTTTGFGPGKHKKMAGVYHFSVYMQTVGPNKATLLAPHRTVGPNKATLLAPHRLRLLWETR